LKIVNLKEVEIIFHAQEGTKYVEVEKG